MEEERKSPVTKVTKNKVETEESPQSPTNDFRNILNENEDKFHKESANLTWKAVIKRCLCCFRGL